ncbi:hypothetical protein TrCOL_g11156 [Triparma columacea]|uniref:tRNA (adenine(58)-N(1))-methyltransferase non-catalytic subunit TRM6 n=1 Tax=Triparma columacea TaxID=722753 RepID=A0A9W7GQB2_9STRA|nr:hypothetical protein TrCOL_g11156 [Triparma columacea]
MSSPTVQKGHICILDFGDRHFFVKAAFGEQVKLAANKSPRVHTTGLIGLPYGCVVEVVGNKLVRTEDDLMSPPLSALEDGKGEKEISSTQMTDNRDLVDSNTSQKIKQDDIQKMKEAGKSGTDIINELISSSETFEGKTEFSKAKYIKRKVKKYVLRARLVRCTSSTVCSLLFFKDAKRYMCLRPDSLAQILSYSNVYAGATVMTFDTIGIPTASIVERMGGKGRILAVHTSQDPPHKQMFERFNFDFRHQAVLKFVSGYELFQGAASESAGQGEKLEDVLGIERDSMVAQGWPVPLQDHTRSHLAEMESDKKREDFLFKRASRFIRKVTRPSLPETMDYLSSQVDSLVICSRHDPLLVLSTLFPYLAPSCPFVIFSEHIQPLASCFDHLKTAQSAIKLQLTETWKRDFQMLEGRTHPEMTMDATGGYILTGVKVSGKVLEVEKRGKLVGMGAAAARNSGRGAVRKKLKDMEEEEGRGKKLKVEGGGGSKGGDMSKGGGGEVS